MASSFNPAALKARLPMPRLAVKDPRVVVRAILGVLLAANVVAALILFKPWGGSDTTEPEMPAVPANPLNLIRLVPA